MKEKSKRDSKRNSEALLVQILLLSSSPLSEMRPQSVPVADVRPGVELNLNPVQSTDIVIFICFLITFF